MTGTNPEDVDEAFAACVRARDLDGLVGLYESDARYIRRDGTVATGHAAIRDLLQTLTHHATEIEMHIVSVVALEGIAIVYNDWTTRAVVEGRVRETTGQAIEVVRRQRDGRWRFAFDDPFGRTR